MDFEKSIATHTRVVLGMGVAAIGNTIGGLLGFR